jgi:hypothetical protein
VIGLAETERQSEHDPLRLTIFTALTLEGTARQE